MEIEEEKRPSSHLLPDEIKQAIDLYRRDAERDGVVITDKEISQQILLNFDRKLGNPTVQRVWKNYQETKSTSNHWHVA